MGGIREMINILVVIPARSGSNGIKDKNVKELNGKKLYKYALQNAMQLKQKVDIVLTTNILEILAYGNAVMNPGLSTLHRKPELCKPDVPLAPVLYDAVTIMEERKGYTYDIVVMMQTTSPTLKAETLEHALDVFINRDTDTYVSTRVIMGIHWYYDIMDKIPNYRLSSTERLNRQNLVGEEYYYETGGFFFTRRKWIKEDSFIGKKVYCWQLSKEESIDIDDEFDWMVAEAVLRKREEEYLDRCELGLEKYEQT